MKAWVLHGVNDIRFEDIAVPKINDDEVLLEVKAAGICGSDIPRTYKDGAHNMPLIIGHEFSGRVAECGANVDKSWLNKKVGVYPLMPCFKCGPCRSGRHEMCRKYDYLGSRSNGGFAEFVVVPERNLIELPEVISYEQAAMLEPMAVAVHAMRRLELEPCDNIVVCGLGTIGMLLAMFLKERGYKNVFVIGNKEFQREKVVKLGIDASDYCDCKTENVAEWVYAKTGEMGADAYFECVGSNASISQAVDLTAPGGKVCLVGNPYGDITLDKAIYWKILRNQLNVTGTWNSSFFVEENESDWKYIVKLLEKGKIQPEMVISHKFGIEELNKGLELMRDKKEHYLKVMMRTMRNS